MDIGTAIALCGGFFSVVAIVYKMVPTKSCNGKVCAEHSGIVQAIKGIDDWLKKIDMKVDKLLGVGE